MMNTSSQQLHNETSMWYPTDKTGGCLRAGPFDEIPYEEIACLYPVLGKTYFSWEATDGVTESHLKVYTFMVANTWLPLAACAIYFGLIVLGQKYFETRPAWNWRRTLAVWNLVIAVFSFWGFMRTAPQLAHNIYYYGWHATLHGAPFSMLGMGSNMHWTLCFVLSKFVELFDTFFIVVHKKKLMLLHWYHHITVLLFCWYSFACQQPMGIVFCAANYGVHSVMYFYYYLMAVKCKPKWFDPQVITVAQILQMVVGVTACSQAWAQADSEGSHVNKNVVMAGLLMYASYLALFVQFFFFRYLSGPADQKEKSL